MHVEHHGQRTPRRRGQALLAALIVLLATLVGCAEGTLQFGGDDDDDQDDARVTVTGTIDNVVPPTTADRILVFVFSDLTDLATCGFAAFADAEVVALTEGELEFSVPNVDGGNLTLVFLRDKAGADADGEINVDEGDEIAVLEDPDGELEDVRPGFTLTVTGVDISFEDPGPACEPGTATAENISESRTPLVGGA